jgi:hypothetical protein
MEDTVLVLREVQTLDPGLDPGLDSMSDVTYLRP